MQGERRGYSFVIIIITFLILLVVCLATVVPQLFVQACTSQIYQVGDYVRVRKLPAGKYDIFDGGPRDCLAERIRADIEVDQPTETYWGHYLGWQEETDTYLFDLDPPNP